MWPASGFIRGGVILAQPVGREARAARRAMRVLGVELAKLGYIAVRLDYPGTGDSSGTIEELDIQRAWTDAIEIAASYLLSIGAKNVSAVGMRLGAVLAATASSRGLTLSSLVLWDPCETGRGFLREVSALESLRRADYEAPTDGSVITSEWVFGPKSVEQIRGLNLTQTGASVRADRVLIISRAARPPSERLRQALGGPQVSWETTSEQEAMLDVEPLKARLATRAIDRIVKWISEEDASLAPLRMDNDSASAVVRGRLVDAPVRERFVRIGRRGLFGIVTEPMSSPHGPLILFFNSANEEHIGTSRLWVDFARAWSAMGVRCLRFDVTGVGDSPAFRKEPSRLWYEDEWLEDVEDVFCHMQPNDPHNVIAIGLCSGAYLAAEGSLWFRARAACLINPTIGTDLIHASATIRRSRIPGRRLITAFMRFLHLNGLWLGTGMWEVIRFVLPRRLSEDLIASVAAQETALLVLSSTDDLSPYAHVPLVRSIDRHRVIAPRGYKVIFVPGLDHGMHAATGRAFAVSEIDAFVRSHFEAEDSRGGN
jgi:alpha-beta hydrolase superfamily lysophospholipase